MEYKKLLNFKTPSFTFKVYSGSLLEKEMLETFKKDPLTLTYLEQFMTYIIETDKSLKNKEEPLQLTNIVYENDKPIGLFTCFNGDDYLIISQGIDPRYRGKKYSSRVKKEFYTHVFKNLPNIERITSYISINNENSLRSIDNIDNLNIKRLKNEDFYEVTLHKSINNNIKKSKF